MKRYLPLFFILTLLNACSPSEPTPEPNLKNNQPDNPELTDYENEVIDYFMKIALGFEFSDDDTLITRKWTDDMKIYVDGEPTPELMQELKEIKDEINQLSSDGFQIEITEDLNSANFYLFFGSSQDYTKIYPRLESYVSANWGLFSLKINDEYEIKEGTMYVDTERANSIEQKHLLREELTQSLGLGNDSYKYESSIFQQDWTIVTEYAEIDKELIGLLYNPKMEAGMEGPEARMTAEEILSSN